MAQATPDHSPEYLSFHENFEALVSTFKAQAAAYADSLFSNGYIPDEFLEFSRLHGVMDSDKSRKILDTIFHRIKVNPSVFHDFIAAIAGPSTDDVGKKLHDSYERHKTATSRVEQPHPPPHQQPPKASLPQTDIPARRWFTNYGALMQEQLNRAQVYSHYLVPNAGRHAAKIEDNYIKSDDSFVQESKYTEIESSFPDIGDEIEEKYIKSGDSSVQESKDAAGFFTLCALRKKQMRPEELEVIARAGKSALSRSSTDEDDIEDCLLLLEKNGLKNARKMVPQMQRKDAEIKALVERFKNVKNQMGDLLVSMSGDQSIVVIVPKMSQNVKKLFTQPFFLEKYRYKLCVQVSMDGSEGSLSVFVHIMKGDFDSILDWPFVHRIAVKVNQKEGDDIVHVVQPDSTGIQKPEVDQNITFGSRNFPTYSELVAEGFVRNDSISIECEVLWN